jgi:hypothetical protein
LQKYHYFNIRSFFLITILIFIVSAKKTKGLSTDFLIIEDPKTLQIYNKYEQQLSPEETKHFIPFCALKIINENEILSDNFTTTIKVILDKDVYYLIKDAEGKIKNINNAGYVERFLKTSAIYDTIQVTKDGSIYLSIPVDKVKNQIYFKENDRLLRLFKLKNKYYVKSLDYPSRYGWSNLVQKTHWKKYVIKKAPLAGIPAELSERFRSKIDYANELMKNIFAYFNQKTGSNLLPPEWTIGVEDKKIICRIKNLNNMQQFKNSTQFLIQDLSAIAQMNRLTVKTGDNKIEISLPE